MRAVGMSTMPLELGLGYLSLEWADYCLDQGRDFPWKEEGTSVCTGPQLKEKLAEEKTERSKDSLQKVLSSRATLCPSF